MKKSTNRIIIKQGILSNKLKGNIKDLICYTRNGQLIIYTKQTIKK